MDMITVTAKTVDEAVTKALIELETTSDKLEYEVVDKGSAGFLGIGATLPLLFGLSSPLLLLTARHCCARRVQNCFYFSSVL